MSAKREREHERMDKGMRTAASKHQTKKAQKKEWLEKEMKARMRTLRNTVNADVFYWVPFPHSYVICLIVCVEYVICRHPKNRLGIRSAV